MRLSRIKQLETLMEDNLFPGIPNLRCKHWWHWLWCHTTSSGIVVSNTVGLRKRREFK